MDALQYRIMRNPETLESYRRWSTASWSRGGPLIIFATFPISFGGGLLGAGLGRHDPRFLWLPNGSLALGGAMVMVGLAWIAWYRSRHPWQEPSPPMSRLAKATEILQAAKSGPPA